MYITCTSTIPEFRTVDNCVLKYKSKYFFPYTQTNSHDCLQIG